MCDVTLKHDTCIRGTGEVKMFSSQRIALLTAYYIFICFDRISVIKYEKFSPEVAVWIFFHVLVNATFQLIYILTYILQQYQLINFRRNTPS